MHAPPPGKPGDQPEDKYATPKRGTFINSSKKNKGGRSRGGSKSSQREDEYEFDAVDRSPEFPQVSLMHTHTPRDIPTTSPTPTHTHTHTHPHAHARTHTHAHNFVFLFFALTHITYRTIK
jgi:hypothetical protein